MVRIKRLWPALVLASLLLVITAGVAWAAPAADDGNIHVVQRGETLAAIARQHGVSLQALMATNAIENPSLIYAGQQLTIPGQEPSQPVEATSANIHLVQPGETLSAIARQYGVSVAALVEANFLQDPSRIASGQRLTIPERPAGSSAAPQQVDEKAQPAGTIYVVRSGDTLASIARAYDTTVAALATANSLSDPSRIAVGQQVRIPSADWAPAVAPQGGLRVQVSIGQQRCWVYQGERLLYDWPCSTGRPGTGTKTGTFYVQSKIREAWGSAFGFFMPYWLGIYWAGSTENGIHGLPYAPGGYPIWANAVGTPVTYGCVLLGAAESRILWEMAYIGMPVTITY